ncbi:hypothetical protein [Pararhizobium sp. PWRC1-1]|uniref:hypothetical protein n=1 Tax=Pararhizobium sp. PWRC1-1 TaxID=2804566 RepID=UPI003CEEA418
MILRARSVLGLALEFDLVEMQPVRLSTARRSSARSTQTGALQERAISAVSVAAIQRVGNILCVAFAKVYKVSAIRRRRQPCSRIYYLPRAVIT